MVDGVNPNEPKITISQDGRMKTTTTETVKDNVTITNIHTEEKIPVHKDPLQSALSGENQTDKTGNSLSTSQKTPEQEANLAKLQAAKEFMEKDEGKDLEEKILGQDGQIDKEQKKWLKKQGIDPDAFMQQWNKAHSDKNKIYNREQAAELKDDMGALANAHLGEDTEEFPQGRAPKKDVEVRNPDKRNFFQKLFTSKEKQKVKDSTKFSQQGGTKVNIHSSKDAERKADFKNDISDDIAKKGQEYLDQYKKGASLGKRKVTFTEIDEETGDKIKTTIKYNKDGSVRKVKVKSDSHGKLKVTAKRDGHIGIKGDLQSDNIMKEEEIKTKDKTIITEHCDEEDNNTYEAGILNKVVAPTKPNKPDKPVKPNPPIPPKPPVPPKPPTPPKPPKPPKPIPSIPQTTVKSLRGGKVSDVPAQTKNFKSGAAVNRDRILNMLEKERVSMKTLIDGYCGNKPTTRYIESSEKGNLNQLNARFLTGIFINAHENGTKTAHGGRQVSNFKADYKKLHDFIMLAYNRDTKADKNNKIGGYIMMEMLNHNRAKNRAGNIPGTNNDKINFASLRLPPAVMNYLKAEYKEIATVK